jgi:hypothetical protein
LGVSLWEGIDRVAALARELFEEISLPVLAEPNEPNVSDLELSYRALTVCNSLIWLVREWPIQNGRRDLEFLGNILTEVLGAVMERDDGFDEPKLRPRPRSPTSSRDDRSRRDFKQLAAIVHNLLVESLGFGINEAAARVAKHIDDRNLIPRKRGSKHEGKCVVSRTILNWYRSFDRGDNLHVLHMQKKAFWPHLTKAGKLRAQGRREAAADALLSILTDASRISGVPAG